MRVLLVYLLFYAGAASAELFSAAGRLENADAEGTCSASLIAPDVIVTAAHCVSEHVDQALWFRLGALRDAEAIAVTKIAIHPLYESFEAQRFRRLRFDIAVGKLETAIDAPGIRPFKLGSEAAQGEGLFIASWPRGSGPRPRQRRCVVIEGRVPAVVTLGCRVRGGESGAPLLRLTPDGVELVAIVNSRAEDRGQSIALASDILPRIEPLLDRLKDGP
ncbi:MAG: trypsin-like serine peptidase [Paracoccaceae bacterium]